MFVYSDPSTVGRPSLVFGRQSSFTNKDNPFTVPSRLSLAPQTPMRVPRESKTMATPDRTSNPFSIVPGRFSLAAHTPGRVKRPEAGTVVTGRGSLASSLQAPQTPQRVVTDGVNLLPGRVSLSAQKATKPLKSITEFDENSRNRPDASNSIRQCLAFSMSTPQRVSRTVNIEDQVTFGRQSLTAQRAAGDCGMPLPGRFSLAAQPPSRVGRKESEGLWVEDGRPSLASQTPGRVARKSTKKVVMDFFYNF